MRFPLSIGILLAFIAGNSYACSVPVFRYALERWKLSKYEIVVFHAPSQSESIKSFRGPTTDANVEWTAIAVDAALDGAEKQLFDRYSAGRALPFVVVRYPDSKADTQPAYVGPLDGSLMALVQSPVRTALTAKLGRGVSGVFVFVPSGDVTADNAAEQLLDAEIAKYPTTLKLPPDDAPGAAVALTAIPIEIEFAKLTLHRNDPTEARFLRLLLGIDPAWSKTAGPMVFAVFGRGRLLEGMTGPTLTADRLQMTAKFLCGACSCNVKELNPGMDLLVSADWPTYLRTELGPMPRETCTVAMDCCKMPSRAQYVEPCVQCTAHGDPSPPWLEAGIGAFGIVAIGFLILRRR